MKLALAIAAACSLVGTAGCSHSVGKPVAPSRAEGPRISVVTPGDCVDRVAVTRTLRGVFAKLRANDSTLQITVTATAGQAGTVASLTVVRGDGKIGLARQYSFATADCDSVAQLLAVTVERFLTAFPAWAGPPRVIEVDNTISARWELIAAASVEGRVRGASGELETLLDFGSGAHRFGVTALWRVASPQDLGSNRFTYMTGAAGLLWRHQGAWHLRAELRLGGTRVRGLGFAQNTSAWLPALEGAFAVERSLGPVRLGLQLSVSPLLQTAVTLDGRFRRRIPWTHFGVVVVVPLWGK